MPIDSTLPDQATARDEEKVQRVVEAEPGGLVQQRPNPGPPPLGLLVPSLLRMQQLDEVVGCDAFVTGS